MGCRVAAVLAAQDVPVAILCGGRGTRLRADAPDLPKPLVEIGGQPIVWHVVRLYAQQGFRRFVLCAGYKGEQLAAFARDADWPADVEVTCVDTGLDTQTGGRLRRVADRLGETTFCATYADGVADVDLAELLRFHAAHGAAATMTVVRPALPFGVAQVDAAGVVRGFVEKPRAEHWVNGGFFVFEARALAEIHADDAVLEREPLEALAAAGQLHAFRHAGFWDCMDTYKDAVVLDDLWRSGRAPWKLWEG
jgi:glucose-1-phosphate cytidylyltransferase